ncbi:carbon-nitrogen hydrolase family protein [Halobacterium wangiae]|uniref:carbon-nitrogen hydrolase family protein n=1 Tax=Halobacterium wangiae TaxID=2902623 RepID=UPI001E4C4D4A|nr:carbon-nitrogen hydrolase family protein [Halobacterium wangiae]
MPTPTVAACQTDVADLHPAANLATVGERLAALDSGVDVALFPEYALTGFVADDRVSDAALHRDGDELDRLAAYASDYDVAVLAGFVEDAEGELYNTAVYVTPDGNRTFYRKRNRWAGERAVLAAGDEAVTVQTPVGEAGIVTCYDLNFVEVSAAFARERVDALFVVGAWPGSYSENWRLLLRARALDGVRWVVGCGRTGRRELPDSPVVEYAGRSAVVRPDGAVSASLNRDDRTLVADLDPDLLAEQREFIPVFAGDS